MAAIKTPLVSRARLHGWVLALALCAGLCAGVTAHAGQGCEPGQPNPEKVARALGLAETTLSALRELQQDEVVLIARVGQDLSKYQLHYSHMGFAVRQGERWTVVHKLNDCGTDQSQVFEQGLLEFFADDVFKYEAGIWRLEPEVQSRLMRTLHGKKSLDYHEPRYSMLAYPFSTQYQNSNGWLLEVLAYGLAPQDEANTRRSAQAWLKESGYRPSELAIGTFTRLGARVTKANIAFDDHPSELRWSGRIQTVTVDSVIDFLRKQPNGCFTKGCPSITVRWPSAQVQP